MDLLLKRGADIEAVSESGMTPLRSALIQDEQGTTKLLLERGADLEAVGLDGGTPLEYAIKRTHFWEWEVENGTIEAKLLLERGANIGVVYSDGKTLLHYTAERAQNSTVNLLIDLGADIERSDHDGQTPLHLAAIGSALPVLMVCGSGRRGCCGRIRKTVALLLDQGGSTEVVDSYGRTPLHLAAIGQKPEDLLLPDPEI